MAINNRTRPCAVVLAIFLLAPLVACSNDDDEVASSADTGQVATDDPQPTPKPAPGSVGKQVCPDGVESEITFSNYSAEYMDGSDAPRTPEAALKKQQAESDNPFRGRSDLDFVDRSEATKANARTAKYELRNASGQAVAWYDLKQGKGGGWVVNTAAECGG